MEKLTAKLGLDISDYEANLKQAETGMSSFGRSIGSKISAAFAVTAVVAFGKAVINSSDALSDKFEAAVAGAKNAVHTFFNTIATGEFDNFIGQLIEGYEKARDLADQLDRLNDLASYTKYLTFDLSVQSGQKLETIRNKGISLTERKKAQKEMEEIEQQIKDKTVQFAQSTLDTELAIWKTKNQKIKLTAEEIKETIQWMYSLSPAEQENINKEVDIANSLKKGLSGDSTRDKYLAQQFYTPEYIKRVQDYADIVQHISKDGIPELFEIHSDYLNTVNTAQDRFNSKMRVTQALLEDVNKTSKESQGGKVVTGNYLDVPYFDIKHLYPEQGLQPYRNEKVEADIYGVTEALQEQEYAVSILSDAFMSLFDDTGDGFDDMIDTMIKGIERLVAEMIAKELVTKIVQYFGGDTGLLDSIFGLFQGGGSTSSLGGTASGAGGGAMDYLNFNSELKGKDIAISLRRVS